MSNAAGADPLPPALPGALIERLRVALATPAAAGAAGNLLGVADDLAAVAAWLREYTDSPHTLRAYTKDAERFLCWLAMRGRGLHTLTYQDVQDYRDFLIAPAPAAFWCCPAGVRRGDPRWRPFAERPLSPRSIAQSLGNLANLCGWLMEARYLDANPFALRRRRRAVAPAATAADAPPPAPPAERNLTRAQWAAAAAAVEALPRDTAYRRLRYHGLRWTLQLLYYAGLRRHEATSNPMAAFTYHSDDRDDDAGVTGWRLTVVGKGGKAREIPVSAPFLAELQVYRQALGWAPLPGEPADAVRPLIVGRSGGPVGDSSLGRWVKEIFTAGAKRLRAAGDHAGADGLARASAHWLRHLRASRLANSAMPLHQVQKILGHASIQTTAGYTHAEARQLARAVAAHDGPSMHLPNREQPDAGEIL